MHIDMKLNFKHILADLGFGGVSHLYWTRKTNMPYNIYTNKYACIDLQEPYEIYFGRKHKVNQEESTPKCDTKGCPNYIKIQINTWMRKESKQQMIDYKTHQHMKCDIKTNQINTTNDR